MEHAELVQKLSKEREQYRCNNECQEIKHVQLAKFAAATMKSLMMEINNQIVETNSKQDSFKREIGSV